MTDGSAAAPIPAVVTEAGTGPAAYARVYEAEQSRLVAYARSLTGSPWLADDLVAEAHFRVWRRLAAGHEIENLPAYLTTTVRHLAATAGRGAARETPVDPQEREGVTIPAQTATGPDPGAHAEGVDLLTRVLARLPRRWVKALWLAEAEGRPLEEVGRGIGAGSGATAVLLHRAREGLREAFLAAHPGTPEDPACQAYWERMPAHVRGAASTRRSEALLAHTDGCDDCRTRLAVLIRVNDRLPALVGPALLVFALGGAGRFLLPPATGSGTAAGAAPTTAHGGGHGSGLLHGVRHAFAGGAKAPAAVVGALGVTVAGAAVAGGLLLTSGGGQAPRERAAAVTSDAPKRTDDAGRAPDRSTAPAVHTPAPRPTQPSRSAQSTPPRQPAPSEQSAQPAPPKPPRSPSGAAVPPAPPAAPRSPAPSGSPDTAPEAPPAPAPTKTRQPATPAPSTPPATPTTPTPTPTPTPTATTPDPMPSTPAPTPDPDLPPTEPTPTAPPGTSDPACHPWVGPLWVCRAG
ncbi:sigma factor [Streptomyces beihaiensis]|uniref:Zf-HC2 domain-containing protein n=1 Tax=Streptomyces beihaiensis TaxID=2984495 RepID=A0ABT3TW03_9ACTN|nr:sigma factor [Streptomyces beihaiensis]MCX3061199.1 zf-HC2 domain-containing protein [Streptomyces beihaiensis]